MLPIRELALQLVILEVGPLVEPLREVVLPHFLGQVLPMPGPPQELITPRVPGQEVEFRLLIQVGQRLLVVQGLILQRLTCSRWQR